MKMDRMYIVKFIIPLMLFATAIHGQKIKVGIDEKLGSYLPMDLEFTTSEGNKIQLKNLITKPTLFALVYYECTGICSPMQNELAWTIDNLQLEPGEDFQVISLSFDHHETPQVSAKWKTNYLKTIKRKFSIEDWIFLTGDSLSIKQLTNSAGFYFIPNEEEFVHASTIIAVSPEGKISRYLFGKTFNPFDVKMALIEAKAGKTNPTISKVLEFCFSYDPKGQQYKLNVTRIIGSIMLFGVGIFLGVLLLKKKKPASS